MLTFLRLYETIMNFKKKLYLIHKNIKFERLQKASRLPVNLDGAMNLACHSNQKLADLINAIASRSKMLYGRCCLIYIEMDRIKSAIFTKNHLKKLIK
jgi:hypothetical protein